jgi:hypothetical protein
MDEAWEQAVRERADAIWEREGRHGHPRPHQPVRKVWLRRRLRLITKSGQEPR